MDKLTLSVVRERIRGKLDDTEASETEIDAAINDFQSWLFTNHRIRFMEDNASISISEGDNTFSGWPDDFLNAITVMVFDSATQYHNIRDLFLEEPEFMSRYGNFSIATPSKVSYWMAFGNTIRTSAPADADYDGFVDYLRKPVFLTSDSDELELDVTYSEMATLGGLRRMMKINEDYAEASQETDDLNDLVTAFVRNEGRGFFNTGPAIMNSRRRKARSEWNA